MPDLPEVPLGIISFDNNGVITTVNESFCQWLGYPAEDLVGEKIEKTFPISTKIFFQTHASPMLKMQGQIEEIYLDLAGKDGNIPVLANLKFDAASGISIMGCMVVRNRKKFEDELLLAKKTAETALKENSELEEVKAELERHVVELDRQLAIINKQVKEFKQINQAVTYNLKESIRKVIVYNEKLATRPAPEELKPDIEKLSDACEHMKDVVTGLQQYIWLDDIATHYLTTDINPIIQKAKEKIAKDTGVEIKLDTENFTQIECDPEQTEMLFLALFDNAVKFRKDDVAKVSITGTTLRLNSFRSLGDNYKFEEYLRIDFRDEGTGFDPTHKLNAFNLFQKFHENEGHGLGLAISRKIVENHHGRIEAMTQPGKFTSIRITLPVENGF